MVNSLNEVEIIDVVGITNSFGAIVNNNGKQEIYVWGKNNTGQLGLGDTTNRLVPTLLDSSKLGNFNSIKELIFCDSESTKIIVDTDIGEQIYVWGENYYGQLGIGNTKAQLNPILFDTTIFGDFKLIKEINFTNKVNGSTTSYAIIIDNMDNDKIFVWGNNNYGQLGIGNTTNQNKPIKFDTTRFGSYASIREFKITQNIGYAILVRADGKNELYTWGRNAEGQLGIGSITSMYPPTKVTAVSGMNIKFFESFYRASFMVVTNNGIDELYTWGSGEHAQLATGDTSNPGNITTPRRVAQSTLFNATEIMQINGMYSIFASVKINGQLRFITWGYNNNGEVMVGNTNTTWTPVLIDNSRFGNFTEVYDSVYTSDIKKWDSYSCYAYVKTASGDKLYTWGRNDYGGLGLGSTGNVYWPVEVQGLNLSTTKITKFPDNFSYSNILKLERNNQIEYFGTGWNTYGQLANGNTANLLNFTKILPTRYTIPSPKVVTSKLTTAEVLNLINPKNIINTKELEKYVDITSFPTNSTLSIDMDKTTTNLEQGILNLAINTDKYEIPLVLDLITTPKTFEIVIDGLWKATNIDSKPIMVKAELFPDEVQKTIEQLYNTICDGTGKVIDRPLLEQYLDLTSIPPTAEIHLSYSSSGYDKQGTFSIETNEVYLNGITTPQVYATKDLMITLGAFPLNLGLIIPLALVGVILLIITIATFISIRKHKYNHLVI